MPSVRCTMGGTLIPPILLSGEIVPQLTFNLADLLNRKSDQLLNAWLEAQPKSGRRLSAGEQQDASRKSRDFMEALKSAASTEKLDDISGPGWNAIKKLLAELSSRRAKDGYTPTETATFVLSLKEPLFAALQEEGGMDTTHAVWQISQILDKLSLYTMETFQKTREEVILR